MSNSNVSRRDFSKLTAAAFGGMVVGTTAGAWSAMAQDKEEEGKKKEVHVCRGLNSCKNHGATGENACAGQGACATAKAHECAGLNACKGQGGCGEMPGENKCKEMGKCAVPLSDKAWKTARARFEERMKKAEKPFGPAPKKAEKKG